MNTILILSLILLVVGLGVSLWRTLSTGGSYPERTSRSARHWSTELPDEPYRDRLRVS
jgi:hypothetical protein